jgi:riboflavin synthase
VPELTFFASPVIRPGQAGNPCENASMFTGIITGVGEITAITALGQSFHHGKHLTVRAPPSYLDDTKLGDSIAINGACMTVTSLNAAARQFTADVSAESLAKTVGLTQVGPVNLEKALRAGDRLGGHIVSGHVDGVGLVKRFQQVGESWELQVLAPSALSRYLVLKGSVTLDGVSLTINSTQDGPEGCLIGINLIPHTVVHTTLDGLKVDSCVNLEIDQIARYVERMLKKDVL